MTGFDFIGDVHGNYAKLERLLAKLGYSNKSGWHHPEGRQAVFVGDIIDRGENQIACVNTVRAMQADGAALCVMGNHEANALRYSAKVWKISRNSPHGSFISEVGQNSDLYNELLSWMETLPLWLDLGDVRVVHACWDPQAVKLLQAHYPEGRSLTRERLAFLSSWKKRMPKAREEDDALEMILKGPVAKLPPGIKFTDENNKVRSEIRLRWWEKDAQTYRQAAMAPHPEILPSTALPSDVRFCPPQRPTVIGHYWISPRDYPKRLTDKLICVDFSAANGGPLVAYRWNEGDKRFKTENFVCSSI